LTAQKGWPASSWYLPAGQLLQCAIDIFSDAGSPYRPAVHGVQLAFTGKLHEPAAHELQAATPAALYCPPGHSLQAVDSITLALICPALHVAHCDADSLAANLPPSHCLQAAALAPLYFPAGHALHEALPAVG
jgi:hypothetical protein